MNRQTGEQCKPRHDNRQQSCRIPTQRSNYHLVIMLTMKNCSFTKTSTTLYMWLYILIQVTLISNYNIHTQYPTSLFTNR